ncbi:MAG: hypothetical protein P4L76_16690, partial [Beijerinckiaceae bacterium]|nr:hypothetical protein [Beijerinckiaceae bacterium]
RLNDAAKQALMDASHEHFRQLPDWWFPEFATTSWSYAGDTDAAEQSRALQTLYRKPEIDAAALRAAMQAYPASSRLLSESFVDACESLPPRELRERLRARVADVLFPKIVACDASLAQFNAWMRQDANPLATDRSALAIAARLAPRAVTKGKGKKPCPA